MKRAKRLFVAATVFMIALAAAAYYVITQDISSTKMQILFAAVISFLAVMTYLLYYFSAAGAKEAAASSKVQKRDQLLIRFGFLVFAVALLLLLIYVVLFVLNLVFPWLVPNLFNGMLTLAALPRFVKLFAILFGGIGILLALLAVFFLVTSFASKGTGSRTRKA